jgi:hypothetical protein
MAARTYPVPTTLPHPVKLFGFVVDFMLALVKRDYMRTDIQPNGEPSDVTVSLPQWLKRNKEHLGAKHRGKGERRAEPQTGAPQTQEGLLNLKDVIRLLRKEVKRAGSQRAFARKSKVNVGVVSKTLRGIVLPSEKILSALNLRLVYLSK